LTVVHEFKLALERNEETANLERLEIHLEFILGGWNFSKNVLQPSNNKLSFIDKAHEIISIYYSY